MTAPYRLQKPQSIARVMRCFLLAKGEMQIAMLHAERLYQRTAPEVIEFFKASIAAGNSSDVSFGAPLSQFRAIVGEFIAGVMARFVAGRLTGPRSVPMKARIAVETSRPRTSWRGPTTSHAKPISISSFTTRQHEPRIATSAFVVTDEHLTFSGSEAALLQSLERGVVHGLDLAFLDPSFAASSDAPTSITADAPLITPTGSTAAAVKSDIRTMGVQVASATNGELESPVIIATPLTILKLALMPDSDGGVAFPRAALQNGFLGGVPLIASTGATTEGSPTTDYLVLVDAAQVLLSDIEDVRFSIAREASVILDDAPAPGASSLVSLWQHNMIGLRAEITTNFSLARANAAASLAVTF